MNLALMRFLRHSGAALAVGRSLAAIADIDVDELTPEGVGLAGVYRDVMWVRRRAEERDRNKERLRDWQEKYAKIPKEARSRPIRYQAPTVH